MAKSRYISSLTLILSGLILGGSLAYWSNIEKGAQTSSDNQKNTTEKGNKQLIHYEENAITSLSNFLNDGYVLDSAKELKAYITKLTPDQLRKEWEFLSQNNTLCFAISSYKHQLLYDLILQRWGELAPRQALAYFDTILLNESIESDFMYNPRDSIYGGWASVDPENAVKYLFQMLDQNDYDQDVYSHYFSEISRSWIKQDPEGFWSWSKKLDYPEKPIKGYYPHPFLFEKLSKDNPVKALNMMNELALSIKDQTNIKSTIFSTYTTIDWKKTKSLILEYSRNEEEKNTLLKEVLPTLIKSHPEQAVKELEPMIDDYFTATCAELLSQYDPEKTLNWSVKHPEFSEFVYTAIQNFYRKNSQACMDWFNNMDKGINRDIAISALINEIKYKDINRALELSSLYDGSYDYAPKSIANLIKQKQEYYQPETELSEELEKLGLDKTLEEKVKQALLTEDTDD